MTILKSFDPWILILDFWILSMQIFKNVYSLTLKINYESALLVNPCLNLNVLKIDTIRKNILQY